MMDGFQIIDLSKIPPPNVVEALNYETVFNEMLSDLRERDPAYDATVESDPAYKILQVCAYRELLLRQRVNDASRAVMLAFASGADLDNLTVPFGVPRMVVSPGDPYAAPPVPPVMESDERLRRRALLAPYGYSCGGSVKAYEFFALSADADVKSAGISSPVPGIVRVTVLSAKGDGTPSPDLLEKVEKTLSAETVRPLCDTVIVVPAAIVHYSVTATLWLGQGPDPKVVLADAEGAVRAYADSVHVMKSLYDAPGPIEGRYGVALSGLYGALHRPGVQRVDLASPLGNIQCGPTEAPWCESVTLAIGGAND